MGPCLFFCNVHLITIPTYFIFLLNMFSRRPATYSAYGGRAETAKRIVVAEGASLSVTDKRGKNAEELAAYMNEFEGGRQRHGAVLSFLEAHVPTAS